MIDVHLPFATLTHMTQLRTWIRGVHLSVHLAAVLGVALLTVGCVDLAGPAPEPILASDVFSEFRFTTDAMMIKPGDTLQTAFVATSAAGTPIPVDLKTVLWQSSDSARVFIDSAGRVTAKAVISNAVEIIAVYTHGTTTRRASLLVYVTADEVSATALKMVALDSTRIGGSMFGVPLPRVRLDLYQGTTRIRTGMKLPVVVPTPYVATYVATGGPDHEPVYTITNASIRLGTFWMTASINLYGTEVHDSVEFTGTYPSANIGGIGFSMDDQGNLMYQGNTRAMLEPCALTVVPNYTSRSLEIVFSDSSALTDVCTPTVLPESFRNPWSYFLLGGIAWTEQVGGNLLLPPMSINVRRSATRGVVTWFARDADTKERLPFAGQYSSIHAD